MLPPLVKLATSAVPGEKKYVALVGAGLSKDAGVPTSWDLMLATAMLLRASEGEGTTKNDNMNELEKWFLNSKYVKMSYADLIGGLFSTSVEQQSFIKEKFGDHKPGKAHTLLAELALNGVLRCIVTTNFDDLIEKALAEKGIDVQVISNDDDLAHSEPLIHCKAFRVYKPHGHLGVGKLRNTPADLESLSPLMEQELVRTLSDHGLMVLGYAGRDPGMIKILNKRTQRYFPTFWVNPSKPPDEIPKMFDQTTFNFIETKGASTFLNELLKMYKKLTAMVPSAGLPREVYSVQEAVIEGRSGVTAAVKQFMEELMKNLDAIAPDFSNPGEHDEWLIQSIDKAKNFVIELSSVAQVIAENNNREAAVALHHAFGKILERYNNPLDFTGHWLKSKFDFYKFIGHELYVTFVSKLLNEKRWQILAEILSEQIFVENAHGHKSDVVNFTYISEYISLFEYRTQKRKLNRVSIHADILYERHSKGELATAVPCKEFLDADYFLFLRADFTRNKESEWVEWRPWSVLLMKDKPKFIVEATSKKYAEALLEPLGISDIEQLRTLLKERPAVLKRFYSHAVFWDPPLTEYFDPASIGSK